MTGRRIRITQDAALSGALAADTLLPTPVGMTALSDIAPGATVFGAEGDQVPVLRVSEIHERPCFQVEFSTGDRIVADAEQEWYTETRDPSRASIGPRRRTTAELAELPTASLAVRVAPAAHIATKRLPVAPYLLGAWLAIGTETSASVALRGARREVIRQLRAQGVGIFASTSDDLHWLGLSGDQPRRNGHLGNQLAQLGVVAERHLPMTYLRAGDDQRRELLAGLLESSAEVSDGGEVVLRALNPALGAGVHQLLASLGYRPWLRYRSPEETAVGFVTSERAFADEALHHQHQRRRRLFPDVRPRRLVVAVHPVAARPVRRIQVGAEDGILLVGPAFVPMPGAATRSTVVDALKPVSGRPLLPPRVTAAGRTTTR